LVRDRSGSIRRLQLVASEGHRLTGAEREAALRKYCGHEEYTYVETFPSAVRCHTLKRYNPRTGAFQFWPKSF